VFKD